jgi:hypothetical protein
MLLCGRLEGYIPIGIANAAHADTATTSSSANDA